MVFGRERYVVNPPMASDLLRAIDFDKVSVRLLKYEPLRFWAVRGRAASNWVAQIGVLDAGGQVEDADGRISPPVRISQAILETSDSGIHFHVHCHDPRFANSSDN